jgi:putrescine transport system permease protein
VTWENFALLFEDPIYGGALVNSLKVAAVSTGLCLLVGYPMALAIARARPAIRPVLLMLVIIPFWTSMLVRTYAVRTWAMRTWAMRTCTVRTCAMRSWSKRT